MQLLALIHLLNALLQLSTISGVRRSGKTINAP